MSDEKDKNWSYSFKFTQEYPPKQYGWLLNQPTVEQMLDQYPILKEFLKDE